MPGAGPGSLMLIRRSRCVPLLPTYEARTAVFGAISPSKREVPLLHVAGRMVACERVHARIRGNCAGPGNGFAIVNDGLFPGSASNSLHSTERRVLRKLRVAGTLARCNRSRNALTHHERWHCPRDATPSRRAEPSCCGPAFR